VFFIFFIFEILDLSFHWSRATVGQIRGKALPSRFSPFTRLEPETLLKGNKCQATWTNLFW